LSYHDFKEISKSTPNFSEKVATCIAKRTAYRMHLLLAYDAMARYQKIMEQESAALLRIPHYMITSYLGSAPETFSRIREKMSAKTT